MIDLKPFDLEAFRHSFEQWAGNVKIHRITLTRSGRWVVFQIELSGNEREEAIRNAILRAWGEQGDTHLGEPQVDFVQFHSFGKSGVWHINVSLLVPLPPIQVEPEPMPIPDKVSPVAQTLLERLYNGADLRVFWRYRVASPTLDGEAMDVATWSAVQNELTRTSEGSFFDGEHWMKTNVFQSALLDFKNVENSEYGVEEKVSLSEAGRKFIEQHIRDLTP